MLEDVVKQIRALLQNQLPGKLDQIELERADGVTLQDTQSFLIQPQRDGRSRYPSIAILGEATRATNALSRRRELSHKIEITLTDRVASADTELLQTRLWRYTEAVERVLGADPTLGGKVIDSQVVSHEYPEADRQVGVFTRSARLFLEALERPSAQGY